MFKWTKLLNWTLKVSSVFNDNKVIILTKIVAMYDVLNSLFWYMYIMSHIFNVTSAYFTFFQGKTFNNITSQRRTSQDSISLPFSSIHEAASLKPHAVSGGQTSYRN